MANPMDLVASLGGMALSSLQVGGSMAMAVGGAAGTALMSTGSAMAKGLGGEAGFFDESITVRLCFAGAMCPGHTYLLVPFPALFPSSPHLPPPVSLTHLSPPIPTPQPLQEAKIKHLLDNVDSAGKSSVSDKVEGMKYILAVRFLLRPRGSAPSAK